MLQTVAVCSCIEWKRSSPPHATGKAITAVEAEEGVALKRRCMVSAEDACKLQQDKGAKDVCHKKIIAGQ